MVSFTEGHDVDDDPRPRRLYLLDVRTALFNKVRQISPIGVDGPSDEVRGPHLVDLLHATRIEGLIPPPTGGCLAPTGGRYGPHPLRRGERVGSRHGGAGEDYCASTCTLQSRRP